MDILTTLPTDAFVTAAFAELLEDVTNLLSAAQQQKPADKDEIGFWKRQLNALNKAESYWLQDVRPVISGAAYLLASASRPGALIHRLSRVGGIVVCSCEAGQKGTLCWHHMLINVLERAAELECLAAQRDDPPGDCPLGDDEGDSIPDAHNPIVHAAVAAQWIAGQQLLTQRLAATAQLLDAMRAAAARPAQAEARRLGVRLVQARKKSAYFTSAFYLEAA